MEFETAAFPTHVGRFIVPDADSLNRDLRALILAEEATDPGLGRSYDGGWHSRPDFLSRDELAVAALRPWVTWAVRRIVDATAGGRFPSRVSLAAWATICRTGAYHAPLADPNCAWSGLYYVDAGSHYPDSLNGALEFLDPRAGAWMMTTPGDVYGKPFRVRPKSGLLVVFPTWLLHWVHPYSGHTPRIAVSFNAAVSSEHAVLTPSSTGAFQTIERGA